MKKVTKFFMAALLAGMCSLGYAQDVKVNINNQEATVQDNCPYRINGICSTEDIGGVNVDITFEDGITWAVFTNYNACTVSVLYQIACPIHDYDGCSHKECDPNLPSRDFWVKHGACGSLVLNDSESKKIKLSEAIGYIGGKCVIDHTCEYSIMGLIVRKLQK